MKLHTIKVSKDGIKYHIVYNNHNRSQAEDIYNYYEQSGLYFVQWYINKDLYCEYEI